MAISAREPPQCWARDDRSGQEGRPNVRAEDACAIRCARSRRCWRGTRCAYDLWLSARTPRTPSIRIQRMRTTSMDGPERHFWRSKFVTEERYVTPHARRWLCISATVLIVLGVLCFTVILIGVLSHSGIASWDKPFAQWMCTHRSPDVTAVIIVLTITSGRWFFPSSSSSSPLSGSPSPNMRGARSFSRVR
jgi:hypothetical protein